MHHSTDPSGGTGAVARGLAVTPFVGYSIVTGAGSAYAFTNVGGGASSLMDLTGSVQHRGWAIARLIRHRPPLPPRRRMPRSHSLIGSQYGPGWIGGDATYAIRSPRARKHSTFPTPLSEPHSASGTATIVGMPSNSELVGAIPDLFSVYGGTYGHRRP